MAKTKTKDADKGKSKAAGPRARNDAYVMMLFLTFAAIVAGSVMMYLDHEEYGGKAAPKEPVPALPKLGESNKMPDPEPVPKADPMDPMPMDPMMPPAGDPKMPDPMEKMP